MKANVSWPFLPARKTVLPAATYYDDTKWSVWWSRHGKHHSVCEWGQDDKLINNNDKNFVVFFVVVFHTAAGCHLCGIEIAIGRPRAGSCLLGNFDSIGEWVSRFSVAWPNHIHDYRRVLWTLEATYKLSGPRKIWPHEPVSVLNRPRDCAAPRVSVELPAPEAIVRHKKPGRERAARVCFLLHVDTPGHVTLRYVTRDAGTARVSAGTCSRYQQVIVGQPSAFCSLSLLVLEHCDCYNALKEL